jgi:ABC-type transporter Mla maintaining outer membrane lipid asymmetry ATPase subunit MlaF
MPSWLHNPLDLPIEQRKPPTTNHRRITHELASAFLIADRMALIDNGNIVAMGTTKEMRSSG